MLGIKAWIIGGVVAVLIAMFLFWKICEARVGIAEARAKAVQARTDRAVARFDRVRRWQRDRPNEAMPTELLESEPMIDLAPPSTTEILESVTMGTIDYLLIAGVLVIATSAIGWQLYKTKAAGGTSSVAKTLDDAWDTSTAISAYVALTGIRKIDAIRNDPEAVAACDLLRVKCTAWVQKPVVVIPTVVVVPTPPVTPPVA